MDCISSCYYFYVLNLSLYICLCTIVFVLYIIFRLITLYFFDYFVFFLRQRHSVNKCNLENKVFAFSGKSMHQTPKHN